jgi:tetratricopeptide (TPR) repeat protein
MNIENIVNDISGPEKTSVLNEIFSNNRLYTFLVGAGISMDPPSCVPSARDIVRELFEYYAPTEEIEELASLDSLRYEFLVDKIQNLFDKDVKFLDYLELVKEPNIIHRFLAKMIMRYNYVITTNFDYLLEIAMKKELSIFPTSYGHHEKLMVIIKKEDYNKDVRFKYPIIKIHGSKYDYINNRSTKESLITTISALGREREKGKTFAIEPYKKKLVNEVTRDRDLVLMGYSGSDDFDITPMLEELNELKRIIWIEHDGNIEFGEENLVKYDQLEDLDELEDSLKISKIDKMLIRLASNKKIEVYKIIANTINFVKQKLAPSFNVIFEGIIKNQPENYISFEDFMEENHFEASNSDKYRLAHEIYFDLGFIDSAERTALRGLELSKTENNEINKTYFINALGLINLSKGDYVQSLEQFEKALNLTKSSEQLQEKIGILLNIGEIYRRKSDFQNALQFTIQAIELANPSTPNILRFTILNNLGSVYKSLGNIDDAIKNLESALEIAEKEGDLFRKALCYNNLAGIKFSQGQLKPALQDANEALKINEQLGDLDDMGFTLNTIGNIYRVAGQYTQALLYLERAYQTSLKIQNLKVQGLAANSTGVIYYQTGKLDLAMKKYNEAYEIREQIGDLSGQATSLNNIGMLYRQQRNYNKALEYFNQSISITEEIGEKSYLGIRYGNQASIYEAMGKYNEAMEGYKKALEIEQSLHNLKGVADQLTNIGGVQGDLGYYDETIKNYNHALEIMEQLEIKPGIANALNNLGMVYYKYKKDYLKSIDLIQKALDIYKELNIPQMINTTLQNLNFIKQKYTSSNS